MRDREVGSRQQGLMLIVASVVLVIIALLLLFWFAVRASIVEQGKWEAFSAAHNCKVVGRVDGSASTVLAPVVGSNGGSGVGVGTATTPGKTGYLCDDGITYWRTK